MFLCCTLFQLKGPLSKKPLIPECGRVCGRQREVKGVNVEGVTARGAGGRGVDQLFHMIRFDLRSLVLHWRPFEEQLWFFRLIHPFYVLLVVRWRSGRRSGPEAAGSGAIYTTHILKLQLFLCGSTVHLHNSSPALSESRRI